MLLRAVLEQKVSKMSIQQGDREGGRGERGCRSKLCWNRR